MKSLLFSILIVAAFLFSSCSHSQTHAQKSSDPQLDSVITGAQVLVQNHQLLNELKGKRVGLVMNATSQVAGTPLVDSLLSLGVNITTLFGPESGIYGSAQGPIKNGTDSTTGLPVYSLYGKTRKPTPQQLKNVDLLLFDMQELGAHFYTYTTTLGLVIEAAAHAGIPVWVLDRPLPSGGNYVAGWTLEKKYKYFVGAYPVPMVYGMTMGELASMIIGKHWIKYDKKPKLKVIKMKGWKRSMKWPDTGLKWRATSPNLPHFQNAYVYLGTVLFEGTNISEGRGTPEPYLTIGAPKTQLTKEELKNLRTTFPAISIDTTTFTPVAIPGTAPHPEYEGRLCRGVKLHVEDINQFNPVKFGVALLRVMLHATPGAHTTSYLYKLAGVDSIKSLQPSWKQDVKKFKAERKPYLLY